MSQVQEIQNNEEKEKLFNLIKALIRALRFAQEGSFEISFNPPLYLSDDEFKSLFDNIDEFGGFVDLGKHFLTDLYYIIGVSKNDNDKCTEKREHIKIIFGFKDNGTYEIIYVGGNIGLKVIDCP